MKIVVAGPKGAGKSTVGMALSKLIGVRAIETDRLIEQLYTQKTSEQKSCRQIYAVHGYEYFRDLEKQVAADMTDVDWQIVITGGSILLAPENRLALRNNALIVFLTTEPNLAWDRATQDGIPPWLEGPDGRKQFDRELTYRNEVIRPYADLVLDTTNDKPMELAQQVRELISVELAVRSRSANTLGDIIRVTTFGESHGPAIGAVLDGIRPGMPFNLDEIQQQMNRRKPGQSEVTTPRSEKDKVEVLSGVFEGKTTGAPIAMIVYNRDQDSSKYEGIKDLFRPGHADFTYYKKYGIRDYRGGGRSSGRETAGRVMCGAVARALLAEYGVRIVAHAIEIAGITAQTCDYDVIENNPVRCADPQAAEKMTDAILKAKDANDSVGGIIQLEVFGVPAGLGDPVFEKLDSRLTRTIMTIAAIKAIEIGDGFSLCRQRGSQANDQMSAEGFLTNHAGGIIGGISTGQPIHLRIGVKPTSSIAKSQKTVDQMMHNQDIETHGRHDPCLVPRIIPVIENMTALALLDAWHVQARLNPEWVSEHGDL